MKTTSKIAHVTSKPLFWVAVVLIMFAAPFAGALSRPAPEQPKNYGTLPHFELTDDKGNSFGTEQLRGRVYVANFVFTSCPVQCPKLMERMLDIQRRTKATSGAVHLVSFSVDPEVDTPEQLHAYAKRFGARHNRWSLLTGDYTVIEKTVVGGFKQAMGKDADNLFEVFHSERFVLVDREGNMRGFYEASDDGIAKLMRDISVVLNVG